MYYLIENIGYPSKDGILGIWNHKSMTNIRNLKLIPHICNKCKYLNSCLGGSRAVSKIVNNSLVKLDYLAQPLEYKDRLFNE